MVSRETSKFLPENQAYAGGGKAAKRRRGGAERATKAAKKSSLADKYGRRPIRLTDAAKATVWSATWTPFGIAHAVTGTATQNLRFPGQYFLVEQGLAYNWHRFYDATTGRYTQPDPLGFVDGPGRFVYGGNSPLMKVDPDGRIAGVLVQGGTNLAKCLANPACRAAMRDGATATAAAAAAGLADAGDLIWSGCEWLYRKITGSGGGGGNGNDEENGDKCEKQSLRDEQMCRMTTLPKSGPRARCWESVQERYGACRTGRPLPQLVTW